MSRSHSTSGDKDAKRETRRRWPLLLLSVAVASSYGALLHWGPPRWGEKALPNSASAPPNATQGQQPAALSALQAALEGELLPANPLTLDQAWHALRGLGPRAPKEAQRLLQELARDGAVKEAPRWAGTEPRIALSVILLESGVPDPQSGTELNELETDDAVTLAFRLELLALALRPLAPAAPDADRAAAQRQLSQLVTQASKRLERHEAPDTYAFARLAQAVFRSAAEGMTAPLMIQMRRLCGRLNGADVTSDDPLLAAARLEALASFVWLSQRWEKAVDPRLSSLLRRQRDELAATLARGSGSSAVNEQERRERVVVAVRALRLSQALLSR